MKQTIERMREIFPCLNKRVVSDRQLSEAFHKFKIDVTYQPLRNNGYFLPAEKSFSGKPEIYINSLLPPIMQRVTGIHELVHFVTHAPLNSTLFSLCDKDSFEVKQERFLRAKHEFEASAVAAISVLPLPKLKNSTRHFFDFFEEEYELPEHIWKLRLYLRSNFNQ